MKRQHHFVVVYDEETNRYSIDWQTTGVLDAVKGGTVYDTEKQEWHSSFDDDLDSLIADRLDKILDEANSQGSPTSTCAKCLDDFNTDELTDEMVCENCV